MYFAKEGRLEKPIGIRVAYIWFDYQIIYK